MPQPLLAQYTRDGKLRVRLGREIGREGADHAKCIKQPTNPRTATGSESPRYSGRRLRKGRGVRIAVERDVRRRFLARASSDFPPRASRSTPGNTRQQNLAFALLSLPSSDSKSEVPQIYFRGRAQLFVCIPLGTGPIPPRCRLIGILISPIRSDTLRATRYTGDWSV